jgi:two-component system, OmpR family, phosphate regulon sensor histidine kinase PhoR
VLSILADVRKANSVDSPDPGALARQGREDWRDRLISSRSVLIAAAAVFCLLPVSAGLPAVYALVGFAAIAAAALLRGSHGKWNRDAQPAPERLDGKTALSILDGVIAHLPEPLIVLDLDGRVLAFNRAVSDIAPALRRTEHLSLALRDPNILDAVRRAARGAGVQRTEFSHRAPARWFTVTVSPMQSSGETAGSGQSLLLVTFADLTELRRVEEMRADFVANASHELRTPLAALSGFIQTLQGPARDDPDARERFLGIMQTQATRMARLIDDLLSLSRVERHAHVRPQTPIELTSVVHQVADGLQTLARDRGVELEISAPAAPIRVLGERDELTRVFENLIENALKYGSSGKRVDVVVACPPRSEREVVVTVRDYGPGIAPEHLPRLTERFYRIDVGHSRAEGGTGLGLALVKHVLNRHRGRLAIESKLGEGATFTVRLPLAPAA